MPSDNPNPQSDVNTSTPASSTGVNQSVPVTTPAVENTVQATPTDTQKVPYDRFKQVIDERNGYESRIKELEEKLTAYEPRTQPQVSPYDKYVQKLVRNGMDQAAAEVLAETMFEASQEVANSKVSPLEQQAAQREINEWTSQFKAKHSDYAELEPEMFEVFKSLPPQAQDLVASGPTGLELLYSHVKRQKLEAKLNESFNNGATQAYQNQDLKKALSNTSGATPVTNTEPLSRKSIGEMSLEEYKAHRERVLANMKQGLIK